MASKKTSQDPASAKTNEAKIVTVDFAVAKASAMSTAKGLAEKAKDAASASAQRVAGAVGDHRLVQGLLAKGIELTEKQLAALKKMTRTGNP